jgi:hypothetical protein
MPVRIAFIGFACMLGAAGCASKQAAMQSTSIDTAVSPATAAAVSLGLSDSLNACLASITGDSTDGTRMIAEQSCRDNEKLHQSVVGTAIVKSGNRASAGTQGDSLEACMARIPTDATVGQRMLAEESCQRDQLSHR